MTLGTVHEKAQKENMGEGRRSAARSSQLRTRASLHSRDSQQTQASAKT